jgi:hypothetical protein
VLPTVRFLLERCHTFDGRGHLRKTADLTLLPDPDARDDAMETSAGFPTHPDNERPDRKRQLTFHVLQYLRRASTHLGRLNAARAQ